VSVSCNKHVVACLNSGSNLVFVYSGSLGNIVRIALTALALAVYELVSVRGNVVRIGLTALALTINEVVGMLGSVGSYGRTVGKNDGDGLPVEGVTKVMLEVKISIGLSVGNYFVVLYTCSGGKLNCVGSALCFVTEGEYLSVGICVGNILSIGVNENDLCNGALESSSVPKQRSLSVFISYLNAVAVVTDLNEFEVNAADSSGACGVHLSCNAKAVNGDFNVSGFAGSLGNVVGIGLAALALAVYEFVSVRGNVVRIALTAFALTVNKVVGMLGSFGNVVGVGCAASALSVNKIVAERLALGCAALASFWCGTGCIAKSVHVFVFTAGKLVD